MWKPDLEEDLASLDISFEYLRIVGTLLLRKAKLLKAKYALFINMAYAASKANNAECK